MRQRRRHGRPRGGAAGRGRRQGGAGELAAAAGFGEGIGFFFREWRRNWLARVSLGLSIREEEIELGLRNSSARDGLNYLYRRMVCGI